MNEESLIRNITSKKSSIIKNNSDISMKQSKINTNNKNIMDLKKKILSSKNLSMTKNYYTKIGSLEQNNAKINKDSFTKECRNNGKTII